MKNGASRGGKLVQLFANSRLAQKPFIANSRLGQRFKKFSEDAAPIKFNNVFRDGIQSNLETNPSAEEMLGMFLHIMDANYDSVQAGGGTFFDLFIRKAREEWGENTALFGAFEDMMTTALIRGDCVVGYNRNPQDVIEAVLAELQERGLKEITNFHGLNDVRMQEGVFKAAKKLGLYAPKVICIEDNPNFEVGTVEGCIEALYAQRGMADSGIYLKNASGKVDPEFVRALVRQIAREFPGEEITFHTHNNHGLAYATSLAAIEAATETGADLALDVLPDPLAEGTAQPSARKMKELIDNHPDQRVRARSPLYNQAGEEPDYDAMYALRFRYRDSEVRYSQRTFDAAYRSGMAGGAMSAVKGMDILPGVQSAYKLQDEDEAFAVLCDMEAQIKVLFGYPTSVTPYQKVMTQSVAFEILQRQMKKEPFSSLHPEAVDYLTGKLGKVPNGASPVLIEMALKTANLERQVEFVPADQLPQGMEAARTALQDAGHENPLRSDVATTAMFGQRGFDHVMKKFKGELSPQQPPEWPKYLREPSENHEFGEGHKGIHVYDIAMAMGGAPALEKFGQAVTEYEKHKNGFYKTEVGPLGFFRRSAEASAGQNGGVRADVSYLENMYVQWQDEAKNEAHLYLRAIPVKMRDYGFTACNVMSAHNHAVESILRDVVQGKIKNPSGDIGLSLSMPEVMEAYKQHRPVTDEVDSRQQERTFASGAAKLTAEVA